MTERAGSISVILLRLYAIVLATAGLSMLVGGVKLIALGGTPYYAVAGSLIILSAFLLFQRKRLGA